MTELELCSITFGPKGCSDARLAIRQTWRPGGLSLEHGVRNPEDATPEALKSVDDELRAAELFWVSPDMCSLIQTARPSVPDESSILRELVPHESGLIFFSTSITSPLRQPIAAMAWHVATETGTEAEFLETALYTHHGTHGFIYNGADVWRFGVRLDSDEAIPPEDVPTAHDQRTLVMTLFALLASPGIASTSTQHVDRPSAKRSARAGIDVHDVRVIYLRPPRRSAGNEGESEPDRYHHRWIVSGHWRSQPYGPGGAFRKPLWIAPHVKGPDGAPLLDGDKVRAVVR